MYLDDHSGTLDAVLGREVKAGAVAGLGVTLFLKKFVAEFDHEGGANESEVARVGSTMLFKDF